MTDNTITPHPKWTPGPWRTFEGEHHLYIEADLGREDERTQLIARAHADNAPANARLIAAAPLLYETLALIRKSLSDKGVSVRIDAVLATARGETK